MRDNLLPAHPLAGLFPMMSEAALVELADDIAANGLREPIWTYRGQVIDGRNRQEACRRAGVEPLVREYEGEDDGLVRFVVSLNMHRRHLTESQRAAVAARLANLSQGQRSDRPASLPVLPVTQAEAAEMLGVSERSVRAAAKVRAQAAPEVVEAVERGQVSVSAAAAVAGLPAEDQREAVQAGPAAVVELARQARPPKANEADRLRARVTDLEAALQDAREAAEAAGALAQDLTAIAEGDAAKRMAQLEAELHTVKVVRDQYMRENAQLKRQIKALERKLGEAA